MPLKALNAERLKTKAKASLKTLAFVVSLSSLVILLSGCSAVGFNKPAALQITSKPEASVFLDGKHVGKTPFFSDQLKSGKHSLKITVSEASFVDEVNLTSGTLTVVNRDLAPSFLAQAGETLYLLPGKHGLFITSMPPEADATVDGKLVGRTPVLMSNIGEGDHKVLITKDGYISREFAIKTTSQYQLSAQVTLASQEAKNIAEGNVPSPQPQIARVEITDTPQGFLRVRQDASIDSAEIGRVKTGDQLDIVRETADWIKVKFPARNASQSDAGGQGKQGWISAQYTKKI
ncbi:MAG: PEGA domain-containing protein [Candidatus Curtissbacteria bacterium]|nr:PEGA domain-containing protein [Candidatus Curtissbacteria bacterium]